MPEGPSIVILREATAHLAGQRIERADGNTTLAKERLAGQTVESLRSWGKHFLIELDDFSVRVHLMMFGSWRIDERKPDAVPRLSLGFAGGRELNFYACSVRFIEEPLDLLYDWREDVMSDLWDPTLAKKKLRSVPGMLVCDALLNQDIFAGVGNIIKNEVLFRIRVHPLSPVGALPARKLDELVKQARQYSFDFYGWKKAFVLRQHWLAHRKKICPRCDIPLRLDDLGTTNRRTFYCCNCQRQY